MRSGKISAFAAIVSLSPYQLIFVTMNVLIVTATALEAKGAGFTEELITEPGKPVQIILPGTDMKAELLITGAGSVATAFWLGRTLLSSSYDLVINTGICGSLKKEITPGQVVSVMIESFADLGAEDHDDFLDQFKIGLADPDSPPYLRGKMVDQINLDFIYEGIPMVEAITVNKVHGNEKSIEKIKQLFPHAATESMEGAAVAYACKLSGVRYIQFRAVSNYVEPRNRDNWKINEALEALRKFFMEYCPVWFRNV